MSSYDCGRALHEVASVLAEEAKRKAELNPSVTAEQDVLAAELAEAYPRIVGELADLLPASAPMTSASGPRKGISMTPMPQVAKTAP